MVAAAAIVVLPARMPSPAPLQPSKGSSVRPIAGAIARTRYLSLSNGLVRADYGPIRVPPPGDLGEEERVDGQQREDADHQHGRPSGGHVGELDTPSAGGHGDAAQHGIGADQPRPAPV